MATKDTSMKFKACQIDFENMMIVECGKEDTLHHHFADIFSDYAIFNKEDRKFDLTIKESCNISPSETEGIV